MGSESIAHEAEAGFTFFVLRFFLMHVIRR